jgi:hypothetical protein
VNINLSVDEGETVQLLILQFKDVHLCSRKSILVQYSKLSTFKKIDSRIKNTIYIAHYNAGDSTKRSDRRIGSRARLLKQNTIPEQGCQIFLDTSYQNGGKYTRLPQHYQIAIKYTK